MSDVALGSQSVKITWLACVSCPVPVGSKNSTPLPTPAHAVRCCRPLPSPLMSKNSFDDDSRVTLMPLPERSSTTGGLPPPPGSVTTGSVTTGSVTTGSVVTGSVVTGSVGTGPVVTGPVVTGSVVAGSVVTGSVVTGPVVTGAVVTGPVVTGPVSLGWAAVFDTPWFVSGALPLVLIVPRNVPSDAHTLPVGPTKKERPSGNVTMSYSNGEGPLVSPFARVTLMPSAVWCSTVTPESEESNEPEPDIPREPESDIPAGPGGAPKIVL